MKRSAPDYDSWLMRGSNYDADDGIGGRASFTMKLRGGTIRVKGDSSIELDQDYDGCTSYLKINLETVHWAFDEEAEVDLTKKETNEIEHEFEQHVGWK